MSNTPATNPASCNSWIILSMTFSVVYAVAELISGLKFFREAWPLISVAPGCLLARAWVPINNISSSEGPIAILPSFLVLQQTWPVNNSLSWRDHVVRDPTVLSLSLPPCSLSSLTSIEWSRRDPVRFWPKGFDPANHALQHGARWDLRRGSRFIF